MEEPPSALDEWMQAAREQLPAVDVRASEEGLSLAWAGGRVDLPAGRIRRFSPSEVEALEGSFLDLRTGLLSVNEPGVLIRVRVAASGPRLTAQLCALLAKGLLPRLGEGPAGGGVRPEMLLLGGNQIRLAREWSREFDADISMMVMSRLLATLRRTGLTASSPRDLSELPLGPTLDQLRANFRMSGVGKCESYRVAPDDVAHLTSEMGSGFAWGTTYTLNQLAGGWVEPRDIVVDPERLRDVRRMLGPPVKTGQGQELLVRAANRVRLSLLAVDCNDGSGARALNPILAACDALNSGDPVRVQLATRLWDRWVQS